MSDTGTGDALLFRPIRLRGVTARNRIVVSPMCQYASDDGTPTDWHLAHLVRFAIGGAGIVFCEETAVEARGRKTYRCAGLWDDRQIPTYRRITALLKSLEAVPAIQLGHSGRKGSCHDAMHDWAPLTERDARDGCPPWTTLAPSALPGEPGRPLPHAMDKGDIDTVITAFAEAARRAAEADFEICEIHGAHGYLIHQFLSPIANQRDDDYGGSRDNRMRFALDVARAVRAAWPDDKPLFYRASCIDGPGGVWDLDDTVALARALKDCGVDVIDCSSGGFHGDSAMPPLVRLPGYQVGFAETIRRDADIATMAVGLITEAQQAETILRHGQADLIAMARELMARADWPVDAARELGMGNHLDLYPPAYRHRLKQRDMTVRANLELADDPQALLEMIERT